ncbi:MAG: undecaprenyl/decaprenyl-phosphate alpha-N-acetylglucosaminyl 1-phosphate transferase [Candidatus Nomurabacteria bacterium]|nr:MAG: undecaprenyl/decaprenyl-phosphate alpha-N-acetylglucosaminyl 1-phosphate transferase [Candidatus Nomurabacteria bacterium]
MSFWLVNGIFFLSSFVLAALSTPLFRRIAYRFHLLDTPASAPERKLQTQPIPLLGGWAIFFSFTMVILLGAWLGWFQDGVISAKALYGVLLGGGLIMVGGTIDDKWGVGPAKQLIWSFLACAIVVVSGIGISFITNPFGGELRLDTLSWSVFTMNDISYQFVVWADLLTLAWLMGMMYTTKLLDGLDGLVSGVGAIASLILFGVTQLQDVQQATTGYIALALAGACLGFLIYNFSPAKIYLGQGGSLLIGFFLGVLSIVSGGKIATALLVMGIPILDVAWVILRRVIIEKRSPLSADRKHLHFRLLDVGFSHRGAVLFLYLLTALFGSATLFFRGVAKLYALGALLLVMCALGIWLVRRYQGFNKS